MTYHSSFCKTECETACGFPILPLKGGSGPAPKSNDDLDIVDEAIAQFRANILFKNFKPQGPADKAIVYLTVFIQKCLNEIAKKGIKVDKAKGKEIFGNVLAEPTFTSQDPNFFMRKLGLLSAPKGGSEEMKFGKYVTQLEEECAARLLEILYAHNAMDLKFWVGMGRKPFLGQKYSGI